jgi:hypothetical protein
MKKILFIALGMIMVATGAAMAADSQPIQLSLTPDIAVFDTNTNINGVALNIWGENPQKAFALGFVNGSKGNSAGFSLGILFNYAETYKGVQWAPVNYVGRDFYGWQAGVANYADNAMKGVQTGVVNGAGVLTGFQLGVVNYAAKAEGGLQIGVVNIISENQWFTDFPKGLAPGMIIVNWRF